MGELTEERFISKGAARGWNHRPKAKSDFFCLTSTLPLFIFNSFAHCKDGVEKMGSVLRQKPYLMRGEKK